MRLILLLAAIVTLVFGPASADRALYVDLARKGWNYQLRTTMIGRDLSVPVHIHGRDLAGASLCLVGEAPHATSLEVLNAFRDLSLQVFGKPLTMRYAGQDASFCGSGRTVVLRLYSGIPPNGDLSRDLHWMNGIYQFGLSPQRYFTATSPAMAQTFFGRRGQGTHIMVKQPALRQPDALERQFYRSILIEELYQSFTFGMDILQFDRSAAFLSKLQEVPMNLRRMNWESRAFMQALLASNPPGLCEFDIFMLYAVAAAPVDQTVDPAFITYIETDYDALLARARRTMADPRFAAIFSPKCQRADL